MLGLLGLTAVSVLFSGAVFAQDKPPAPDAKADAAASRSEESAAPTPKAPSKDEKQSSSSGTTRLKIQVTANDKPVGNAAVYVRFNTSGGLLRKDKLAELDFKTNEDGSVKVPEIPRGRVLIQVVAKGWHTYGKWYEIETDQETIQIRLAPLGTHWY